MSRRSRSSKAAKRQAHASVFAALGDETRLSLVAKLCRRAAAFDLSAHRRAPGLPGRRSPSIFACWRGREIVHSVRTGRESLFEFDPEPIEEIKEYLDLVSAQWDQALSRLKSFVEGA